MKISAVIPAYNEEENILILVKRFKNVFAELNIDFEIIIVVQGEDGTIEKLKNLQDSGLLELKLIYFREPLGVAKAFKIGFDAIAADTTHILTMDGDLNHQPEELPHFLKAIDQENVDIVIGSRYVKGGMMHGLPTWKYLLSRLVNNILSHLTKLHDIKDKTSGYRLCKREVIDKVKNRVRAKNFDFYVEFLIWAQKNGFKMVEIPIIFKYRREGRSKMGKIDTFLRYMKLFIRLEAGEFNDK
ncbi:MAG: glycosyltransferase [Candidatus Omnitrophota bacterium]